MRTTLLLCFFLLSGCRDGDKPNETGTVDTNTVDTSDPGTDADHDGFTAIEDCDDLDGATYPGAPEICDGIDNDCDGDVDENVTSTWYPDGDGDGYGSGSAPIDDCEPGQGYTDNASDCNDLNADVYPGAEETCDGSDNNCDGETDEDDATDALTWYEDGDGDGWGNEDITETSCDAPAGYVIQGGDCDDVDPSYHPGALEADCTDSNDYNCDGSVGYADADSDGYAACDDCDDNNADANDDATETCDGADNDCDGTIDEPDAIDTTTWYGDADGDGYGGSQFQQEACSSPANFVATNDDCDDLDPNSHPGASEVCDETDNDCDTEIDEGVENTWYADTDGDGYGDATSTTEACNQPPGYSTNGNDCNDASAATSPAAYEICDGLDNDCDSEIDEANAINATTWYPDGDGDGYGTNASSQVACDAPSNHVNNDSDCNDSDGTVNPGASEICDTVDNDCDGTTDESDATNATTWYPDGDGDGYGSSSSSQLACDAPSNHVNNGSDCNDADGTVNPGASEVCDTVDNNCDSNIDEGTAIDASTWYADTDGDTYGNPADSTSACTQPTGYIADNTDCNDTAANAFPGGVEVCDSLDNNCDGTVDENTATDADTWYADADSDTFGDASSSTLSCNQPSGYVADATDCDDTPGSGAAINTSATETCDGIDNDCDGNLLLGTTTSCSATSCEAILQASPTTPADGLYTLDPDNGGTFEAYCDMSTNGGGWTLALRVSRHDGGIDFHSGGSGWSSTGYSDVSSISLTDPGHAQDHVSPAYERLGASDMLLRHSLSSDLYAIYTSDGFLGSQSARSYISQSMVDGGRACSNNITYIDSATPHHANYDNLVLAGDENGDTEPGRIAIRAGCAGDTETLQMGYTRNAHGDNEVWSQGNHWGDLTSMFVFVR